MFCLYLNNEELRRRCKANGIHAPRSRPALIDACTSHNLITGLHKTALRFEKQEYVAATTFLEQEAELQECRDHVFHQYTDYFCSSDYRHHKGYTISYHEIEERVKDEEDSIRLDAMRAWSEENGGLAEVMMNEEVPSSLRLALWTDHVNAFRRAAHIACDVDIISKVFASVDEDTICWDDDRLRSHISELNAKCMACKEARRVVRDWLDERLVAWTSTGSTVKGKYKFCTELSADDITAAFGDAAELERVQWGERILQLSTRACKPPAHVAEALRRRQCIRCLGQHASACVAHMCGNCCNKQGCGRHRTPSTSHKSTKS